jgi:hypothetical protein
VNCQAAAKPELSIERSTPPCCRGVMQQRSEVPEYVRTLQQWRILQCHKDASQHTVRVMQQKKKSSLRHDTNWSSVTDYRVRTLDHPAEYQRTRQGSSGHPEALDRTRNTVSCHSWLTPPVYHRLHCLDRSGRLTAARQASAGTHHRHSQGSPILPSLR